MLLGRRATSVLLGGKEFEPKVKNYCFKHVSFKRCGEQADATLVYHRKGQGANKIFDGHGTQGKKPPAVVIFQPKIALWITFRTPLE